MTLPVRKIIHVDMDAFYASVEQRDQPSLRGRPLAVAWGGKRSVVLTASYEARPFGVRSAMPLYKALERCPQLLVVPPRFEAYRAVSEQIRQVFAAHTPLIEPLSLDEAYLDVSEGTGEQGRVSATRTAQAIRAQILAQTGLTATAGVSVNKFLAKLASGLNKPDGLTVILPEQVQALLDPLPVAAFHGVGPATAARLAWLGIQTGADLRLASEELLCGQFGRLGQHLWQIAHGQDERPVNPHRPHKSMGAEETYADDLRGVGEVYAALPQIAEQVERRLRRAGLAAHTVILKIKFADWQVVTRRLSLTYPVQDAASLLEVAARLLTPDLLSNRLVRLVGLTATGLTEPKPPPPSLFG